MAGTWKWYGKGLLHLLAGDLDFDPTGGNSTFKLMLTSSSYTPDQDAHEFRSIVSNEVTNSGTYASGGATLNGLTIDYNAATNEARIAWSDPQFTSATITARTAVIYKSTGSASTDILVAYCTESSDVSSTAGTFTVDLPNPTLKITAA